MELEKHMRYNPKKHRLPVCNTTGILLIDKPKDWTSFDVVNFVRANFNIPKVGHCGTLDPAATGLLVLVLGKFTALSSRLAGEDKIYQATVKLGLATDSGDLEGETIEEKDPSYISEEQLKEAILSFKGDQMQTPPMVSAVKVGGKKLYELARKGIEVDREARPITINEITIDNMHFPECDFTLDCSKGTYVRVLCQDIGTKLGCPAVLSSLRRIRSGRFSIENALTIEQLKTFDQDSLSNYINSKLAEMAEQNE